MRWLVCGNYPSCFNIRGSNTTRLAYCFLLLFFTSLSACLLSRHVTNYLSDFVDIEERCLTLSNYVSNQTKFKIYCSDLLTVSGSYRIFTSLSLFHLIMSFITIGIENNQNVRAKIHNGFWLFKVRFFHFEGRGLGSDSTTFYGTFETINCFRIWANTKLRTSPLEITDTIICYTFSFYLFSCW